MNKKSDNPLQSILRQFVDNYQLKPKLNQVKIANIWKQLMGPTISAYTRELYVRNGKLFLHIDSAPLKQELSYGKEKIKERLNEELGEDFIQEVIIR